MASRSLIKAKNKSDLKDSILKSYYKYHRWGFQKGKNFQKITIGRGCIDLKNSKFLLLWAQCISDKILKVASSEAILKVGPKKKWYGHIKWDWNKALMNEFGDFNVSSGWLSWFYGHLDSECCTLYYLRTTVNTSYFSSNHGLVKESYWTVVFPWQFLHQN